MAGSLQLFLIYEPMVIAIQISQLFINFAPNLQYSLIAPYTRDEANAIYFLITAFHVPCTIDTRSVITLRAGDMTAMPLASTILMTMLEMCLPKRPIVDPINYLHHFLYLLGNQFTIEPLLYRYNVSIDL